MKNSIGVTIAAVSLLMGAMLFFAQPGLASAIGALANQPQTVAYHIFSVAPSDGTNVARTQVIPGTSGDLHLAYSAYSANAANKFPAYYAHCAASCATPANWSLAEVGEILAWGNYTRLAVDANDHPRMMWKPWAPGDVTGTVQYAECNSGCSNKGNWSTPITVAETGGTGEPNDYFSLDRLGRPRFVYADNRNTHKGTFYVYCDSGCASAGNWHEVTIATVETFQFSLAFTASNQPRLAFAYFDNTNYSVGYAECNSSCDNSAQWGNALLYSVGPQVNLRLRLDSNNRPRLAFYTGVIGGGDPANDLLFYTWCNTSCLTGSNWNSANAWLPTHYGETLDLALDNQNLPQLALYANISPFGLVYSNCSANCETASGTWASHWVETTADMNARVPVAVESGCSISQWYPGSRPSIALVAGVPVFSYDAEHLQAGTCTAHTDIYDATLALGFSQSAQYFIYLPRVTK
jgi:hypothetical protein